MLGLLMEIHTTAQKVDHQQHFKNMINSPDSQITGDTEKENHAKDTAGMQSANPKALQKK